MSKVSGRGPPNHNACRRSMRDPIVAVTGPDWPGKSTLARVRAPRYPATSARRSSRYARAAHPQRVEMQLCIIGRRTEPPSRTVVRAEYRLTRDIRRYARPVIPCFSQAMAPR